MSPRLSFLPCDPLRVQEITAGPNQLHHCTHEGGTSNRPLPVARGSAELHRRDVVADGEGFFRFKCSCGYFSRALLTYEDAEIRPCEIEAELAWSIERYERFKQSR